MNLKHMTKVNIYKLTTLCKEMFETGFSGRRMIPWYVLKMTGPFIDETRSTFRRYIYLKIPREQKVRDNNIKHINYDK